MKKIFASASKLVLLYVVGVLGLLALFAGCWSVATNTFSEMAKIIIGIFGTAITFVMGFYFGYKGDTPTGPGTVTKTETTESQIPESFAGK